jgi:hypothetical protein
LALYWKSTTRIITDKRHTPAKPINNRMVASYDDGKKDGERTTCGNKYCGTLASSQIAFIVIGLDQAGV